MRAIRFVGAGFDPGQGGGLGLTAAGGLAMTDGDETVRQALFLLLSTTPGERLMRPGYGSRLHRLVFAPNDDTTAGLAIHYVRAPSRAGSTASTCSTSTPDRIPTTRGGW